MLLMFLVRYVRKKEKGDHPYETHLVGSKFKCAQKSASSNSRSVPTVSAQRTRECELLRMPSDVSMAFPLLSEVRK